MLPPTRFIRLPALALRRLSIQPWIIKQLLCSISLFWIPLHHPLDKTNELNLLLATYTFDGAVKAETFRNSPRIFEFSWI
jgi:hypothetical protein